MNNQALRIYRQLSEQSEDVNNYKNYLENLYTYINESNAESYWNDFLEITREMLHIFINMGFTSFCNYHQEKLNVGTVTEEYFRGIIKELYPIALESGKDYETNIRCCILCKEKIYYLPIPDEYNQAKIKYKLTASRSETLNKKEYICPVCGSLDRERLIVAYLEKSNLLSDTNINLLQIAPAKSIEEYLRTNYPEVKYESGDLCMEGVTYQLDLQNMHMISDNSYDIWICSHVLEHVPDDRKALRELYRILKKDGIGILLVPIDLNCVETDEELGCTEEENWRRFGQGDHVRKYAKADFIKRIEESGFTVELLGKEYFGEELFKDNGFTNTTTLYVVKK